MRLCHFLSTLSHICVFLFWYIIASHPVEPFLLKALIHSVLRWNLISLFQRDGLCENSKKKEKKKNWKKKRKKESVKKKKIKGFSSNFEKWNGRKEYCFEKEVEVKKKNLLNGNSKKSWHSDKSWKHFLYLPSPIFISFPFLLPYITSW